MFKSLVLSTHFQASLTVRMLPSGADSNRPQILTGLSQWPPTPIPTPTPLSLLSCPFTVPCHLQGTCKATPEHRGRAGNKAGLSEWAVIVAGQGSGGGTDGEHSGFCATAYSEWPGCAGLCPIGESWPGGQCHWPGDSDGGYQHMGN